MTSPLRLSVAVLVAVPAALFTGCTSTAPAAKPPVHRGPAHSSGHASAAREEHDESMDRRSSRVKIGMSKGQVASIMDDDGHSQGMSQSAYGSMETVYYSAGYGSGMVSALKSNYTMGFAGHSHTQGMYVTYRNGRVSNISTHN